MTLMNLPGALRFAGCVDTKKNRNGFPPAGSVIGRVEQAHIELEVRHIIVAQLRAG